MTQDIDRKTLRFNSINFKGLAPGPRLVVTGAVHGNETCGTQAITRVLAEVNSGKIPIVAGEVTFVPVTNPLAYAKGERSGDRNLNRNLSPTSDPKEFEDHVANWLCPILARHDVLLDLHSTRAKSQPFAMLGPRDNHGPNSVGVFSCSKSTNEMNYVAQKFARVAIGTNNIDSCNRT